MVDINITDLDIATALRDPDLGLQLRYIALVRMVGERDAEMVKMASHLQLLNDELVRLKTDDLTDDGPGEDGPDLEPEPSTNGLNEKEAGVLSDHG
jgi:hypothetical protein